LTYYLKRVTQPAPRPLAALEVLWQLATELQVPLFAEERQQGEALHEAVAVLWAKLSASASRLNALVQAAAAHGLEEHSDYHMLMAHMLAIAPELSHAEAAALLQDALGWFSADVPALTALIEALERTQLHLFLTVNNDLSLTRPAYLDDDTLVAHLHHVLSRSLRPALLRHGALLSPMEATIYHQPEPGAPPFVTVGEEVKVGQTLALLEAMKMFSELPSPVDGVVLEVLVESGQGVKTGTPLFRIATQDMNLETTEDGRHRVFEGTVEHPFGLLRPLTAHKP
jgi:biotin carboxyl carrier protein